MALLCTICHKEYEYNIGMYPVDKIIIDRTTDIAHVYYTDGDVIHYDMDKTIVRIDSTANEILVNKSIYKFK